MKKEQPDLEAVQPQIVAAVCNIAGGVGKSSLCRHCLSPLIPGSVLVSIEDWNSAGGVADLEISAKAFHSLAAQLNSDDQGSYILDIGASNSREMFKHFDVLTSTRERITHWLVPTRAGLKERVDTLKTIQLLLKMNVAPASITIVAQFVTDPETFESDFGELKTVAREFGFNFAEQAVLFSPLFEHFKEASRSVFEIVQNKPDFAVLRKSAAGNEATLMQLGHQIVVHDLAVSAARNYRGVFESLDLARQVYGRA
jgi:hypothetical protein